MITRNKACQVMCAICMSVCQDEIGRIQCAHSYCFSCILEWSRVTNSCPICRQKITQIHKLKVQPPQNRRFNSIEPQTITIPQTRSEEQSQWQIAVSQHQEQLLLFSQNIFLDHIGFFSTEQQSIFQSRSVRFSFLVANIRMME